MNALHMVNNVSRRRLDCGPRFTTNAEMLLQNPGGASLVLIDGLLLSLRSVLSATDLDLDDFLIYGTILAANKQRGARAQGGAVRADECDLLVPISQAAVARATGLPRETVRRKIGGLLTRDLVMMTDGGCVATGQSLAHDTALLLQMSAIFVRTGNSLLDLGVLVTDGAQVSGKMADF